MTRRAFEVRGFAAVVPAAGRPDTFEEERAEVLDSVFYALCRHNPDLDEMAACAYLMHHLNAPLPPRVD
ncbi:MAG: hypothetical protein JST11_20595 [Acidobacteria bacterium]|nr:hypothetical protein [Acidobacteriota bacterium]